MTTTATTPRRPLPLIQGARAVFDLTLGGTLWSRRSLVMALLVGLPVLLAILYRVMLIAGVSARARGLDLYHNLLLLYYVRNVLPLVALFYATSLVADEVEGRTLTYLLSRPVTRPSVLAGKYVAYLASAAGLVLPAMLLTFGLLATDRGLGDLARALPGLLRDLGVVGLALGAYGALFTLLGVVLRRPLIPGLLFLFFWELAAHLPGHLPRFTITAYLRSLIPYRPVEEGVLSLLALLGSVPERIPPGTCLLALAGITAVCLAAAFWVFSRREYVSDQ